MDRIIRIFLRLTLRGLIALGFIMITTYGWAEPLSVNGNQLREQGEIEQNLKNTVVHLSETIGIRNYKYYKNLNLTADYIIAEFKKFGYEVEIMTYEIENKEYKNIIAKKVDEEETKGVIVIGAHYDSCFNPGADDNASGVAGVIELARIFKDKQSEDALRFVAFVNEEPPFFQTDQMGSFVYAKKMKEKGENIKTAIILEMIGFYTDKKNSQRYPPLIGPFYPNKGNFVAVVGNIKSRKIVKNILGPFKEAVNLPIRSLVAPAFIPGINFSDHWSFWKNGFLAVMITDTAYLRNKNYHKETDTAETLDFQKMADVILGLKAFLLDQK